MGYNIALVVIHTKREMNNETFLEKLGFEGLKFIGNTCFDVAMSDFVIHPFDKTVFIGRYKNNFLVFHNDFCESILSERLMQKEKTLMRLFPDAEVCALLLQSVINGWGYAISRNYQKIRTRRGDWNEGTYLDYGKPVGEEMELLLDSMIDEYGNRVYSFEHCPDEILEEHQVGENFVFKICERYFGFPLDKISYMDLWEMHIFAEYNYTNWE